MTATLSRQLRYRQAQRERDLLERMWALGVYRETGRYLVTGGGLVKISGPESRSPARGRIHRTPRLAWDASIRNSRIADNRRRAASGASIAGASNQAWNPSREEESSTEAQRRRADPSIYDLARLTPHQRWQRTHTETLIEPAPGSGLIVRGEISMPGRQYARAVATHQTPPALRVHAVTEVNECTVAPHDRHVTVPIGQEPISWRECKRRFIEGVRYKYVPQDSHVHPVRLFEVEDQLRWVCQAKGCASYGYEPYTLDTLGATTHLVWHECVECSRPQFWEAPRPDLPPGAPEGRWGVLSRRDWLKTFGLAAAGVGYDYWLSAFCSRFGIPFVPPAEGAADAFFVDFLNGNDSTGTGSSGNPWKTYEKARQNMATNDGDSVAGRGGDVANQRYPESFTHAAGTQFPSGPSFAQATIVKKDTGHTPVLNPTTIGGGLGYVIHTGGSAAQYIIFQGLTIDMAPGTYEGGAYAFTANNGATSGGSHHIRATDCVAKNDPSGHSQAGFVQAYGHDHEVISCRHQDGGPPYSVYNSGAHGAYVEAIDTLIDGLEYINCKGFCIHAFISSGTESDRSVFRRIKAHGGASARTGIRLNSSSQMAYFNQVFDHGTNGSDGIGITQDFQSPLPSGMQVINNTVADNAGMNGIWISSSSPGVRLRNNIAVSNGLTNFLNQGNNTNHANNSWNDGSFVANFVNQAARDYRLTTSSSARNTGSGESSALLGGTYPYSPVLDFNGVTVPKESVWDLGANEFDPPPTGGAGVGGDNNAQIWRGRLRHGQ